MNIREIDIMLKLGLIALDEANDGYSFIIIILSV